ncbi:biotin-dependent carboxyltransferase family protein [Salinibacterium sp. M195]|uniref:5-oxoprolinase subunit C family protein n=1 Tax=Salinibacterium sp. M195 TaxID=2583374 RepID=UPI002105D169|nr:biotin-dependent carboxyltransferase family protein [Salinibacterium sp. M195]QYH36247.1 biotin-dependent carboxyltransferase family protein [Salinibacterium sp. M195]
MTGLVVIQPGPLTLVQDLGRPGLAHLGVGASGAMDRSALALGNRLVGNTSLAAGLEILIGGVELRAAEALWLAVTGAWGSVTIGGRAVPQNTPTQINAGETITWETATHGIRYYLAVRGGIEAPRVLGSRSRDTLAQLGPAPLAAGDVLRVGAECSGPVPLVDLVPVDAPPDGPVTIEVRPGPRRDWFSREAWSRLCGGEWRVSPRSDRSGIRLDGRVLERTERRELPSEGMLSGAIQVSPDGAPTILAVDHPVTGGYPVIAVVTDDSLDALAQLRPGQIIMVRLATGRG